MSATRWYIRADLLNILRFTSFCFHHTHLPLATISNRFARQVSDEWYNIDCPRAARVAESPHSNRRQRHHHLRARHDSNCRFRRCGGGLLSRQFGQDRAAGGHRRDRVDAVKERGNGDQFAVADAGDDLSHRAIYASRSNRSDGERRVHEQRRFAGRGHILRERQVRLHEPGRRVVHESRGRLPGEVGQLAPARRACAGQHRIDGRRRQDQRS
jgi:hypothetical protein